MPLNWLSNLQFSKDDPYKWNTKDLKTQQNEIRDLDRKRAIERSMAGSMDASGNFSEQALRSNLIKEGFGEDAERVANDVTGKRMDQMGKETEAKQKAFLMMLQGLMTKEDYQKRFGGTTSETIEIQPISQPSTTQLSDSFQPISQPSSEKPSQTPSEQIGGNDVVVEGSGFKSKVPELKLQDIQTPKSYETVEKKIQPQVVPGYLASTVTPDVSFFRPDVSKTGDKSSGGSFTTETMTQDEKDNLSRTLNRFGVSTKDRSLEQAYGELEGKAIASVPVPVYNPMAEKPGEEYGRYQRELAEYPAKVQAKRLELQEKVKAGYGEVQGLGLSKESQDFALAQQKNKDVFIRPVSPKEAELVYKIRSEYSDISNAGKSFEDAYQAALSVSKLDGSISLDNVLANLVSMKAFPSKEAAQIRLMLDPKIDIASMTGNAFYNVIADAAKKSGIEVGTPKGADPSWVNKTIQKYNDILSMNGGKPMGSTSGSSKESPKSGAAKQVESKRKPKDEPKKPSDPLGIR